MTTTSSAWRSVKASTSSLRSFSRQSKAINEVGQKGADFLAGRSARLGNQPCHASNSRQNRRRSLSHLLLGTRPIESVSDRLCRSRHQLSTEDFEALD